MCPAVQRGKNAGGAQNNLVNDDPHPPRSGHTAEAHRTTPAAREPTPSKAIPANGRTSDAHRTTQPLANPHLQKPSTRTEPARDKGVLRALARWKALRSHRARAATHAFADAWPQVSCGGAAHRAAGRTPPHSLPSPPFERRCGHGAEGRSQARLPRLQRRARHVGDPALADRGVRLRGRRLLRRRRPGGGALRAAREGAAPPAPSTASCATCARSSCATSCSRRSAATRSTRAATCSAPRSRGR